MSDIPQEISPTPAAWSVYMILCSDNSLYTGITNNLSRRFKQHSENQGAKYFRGRRALKVVYVEDGHNRSSAARREFAIKQLKLADKLSLLVCETNKISKYNV